MMFDSTKASDNPSIVSRTSRQSSTVVRPSLVLTMLVDRDNPLVKDTTLLSDGVFRGRGVGVRAKVEVAEPSVLSEAVIVGRDEA